ncbi:PREDICTED: LOC110102797 isoform [Prunus dulcis]|uniref:PREDICTED: LOC110102797 isoform n=1 Tax=Prunus dulcis TaxID=3755 RepID=A0A5E4E6N1_PRUDU|nr:uncharacterized protein LOC117619400 [Prunus dulcis]KAI5347341.1 hypothetical protein L3X38_015220 [Prunus dulcis]VVA11473.1 PREDICTED: LOC110102797 isoform [Prunus dulcis]
MAKFNEVQKRKRTQKAERKRAVHGDPSTGKLKNKPQPLSISGKRKRKLLKKWRRDQNEAVQKGLITMQDVEMAAADGGEESTDTKKTCSKFPMKKGLKLKQLKRKGRNKGKSSSKPAATAEASLDANAMLE